MEINVREARTQLSSLLDEVEGGGEVVILRRGRKVARLVPHLPEPRFLPSLREYARVFGLNEKKLTKAKPDVLIMHPGPINRGVEISPAVADGPYSVILDQVNNGVAVRMALLYLLIGGERDE